MEVLIYRQQNAQWLSVLCFWHLMYCFQGSFAYVYVYMRMSLQSYVS